jgi:putative SOS response-associated peptidase YedK
MCGRFSVIEKPLSAFVNDEFGIEFHTQDNQDVRPTQQVATVINESGKYSQQDASWGIKPAWSKKILINAQAETAAVKKTFANAMKTSRCLVPCSGWYEWSSIKGSKQKYIFEKPQHEALLMAGILFKNELENRIQLVTLTNVPNAECLPYHGRMPLLIEKDEIDFWFNSKSDQLLPLLQHNSEQGGIEKYRISVSD